MSNWRMVPLGFCVSEVRWKNLGGREQNLLSLSYGNIVRKDIASAEGLLPESFDTYNIVEAGDTVLRLTDLQNDQRSLRVGFVHETGIVTSAYISVRPQSFMDPRFLNYYLKNLDFRKHFYALGAGVRQSLKFEELRRVSVEVPPLHVQRKIADYLETTIAHTNEIVTRKRQMLEIENERETSLLCAYFLPCFNPDNRGYIPLKRLATKVIRPAPVDADVVTAFRDGTVTLRSNRREVGFTFSETESTYIGVEPGDLVFHGLDGFEGAVGVSDSRGRLSPVSHTLLCDTGRAVPRYLALTLRALGRIGYLSGLSSNVRQRAVDFRNFANLGVVRLPLPSVEHQLVALEKFDSAFARSKHVRVLLERHLVILAERREALIAAAVTGEHEVPGVAA